MRKLCVLVCLGAGVAIASVLIASPASAGGKNDWVCWMQTSGVTKCAALPEPYRVRDVQWKPHKHRGFKQPCRHCSVDFGLTHANIHDLGRYTDNSSMRTYHDSALYGNKYRGPYRH